MPTSDKRYNIPEILPLLSTIKNTVPMWVLGTEEAAHQNGLINIFDHFSQSYPELGKVSRRLADLVWMQNPLDRTAVSRCLQHDSRPGPKSRLLQSITSTPQANIPVEDLENLLLSADSKLIIRHLFPFLRGPAALDWLAGSWNNLLRLGNPELVSNALDIIDWKEDFIQIKHRLKVEFKFLYYTPEQTLDELENLDEKVWYLWKNYLRAELMLRSGAKEEGTSVLETLWKENSWNLNWGQKLHALRYPLTTKNVLENSDDVAILLYSWNNGTLIENTLKNVASTNIGNARVFALNNGSGDNTGEVVSNAASLFAEGNYKGIQLPVNVGAPPARNWLLAEPEVRKSKWAVFLDDDIELPQNWLEELLATAKQFGNPGAVGCRITSTSAPKCLQSADYHLFHPGNGSSQIEGLTERVMVFDSCRNAFDCGQFSYTRPAIHLSGCCHMLNMEAVHKCGGFDVRFNPTQFDDLERDLRAYLAGYTHIYAGQLGIGHIQHSSLAKASNVRSMAQVFGNKIKLESKYTENDLTAIFSRDLSTLWADTEKKWGELTG